MTAGNRINRAFDEIAKDFLSTGLKVSKITICFKTHYNQF